MTVVTTNTDTGGAVNVEIAQTEESVYIQSYASVLSDTASAIHSISAYFGTTVYNAGTVIGDIGINLEGGNDLITNAAGGHIGGHSQGIKLHGGVNYVNNYGTIDGFLYAAIDASGSYGAVIYNAGTISGGPGIYLYNSGGSVITNTGVINASGNAIYSGGTIYADPNTSSDFDIVVNNSGTIFGNVLLNDFSPTVHNSGVIHGDVILGRGTGRFDGIGGTIDGSLTGGTGNDTFDLSHQTVTGTISGGGGEDKVSFDSASGGMTVDLVQGTATGGGEAFDFSGISDILGSHYGDVITGDGNANVIASGSGNDSVSGGAGNDTIDGGAGNDALDGGSGTSDTVSYTSSSSGVSVSLALQGHAQNTIRSGTDTLFNFENLTGSNAADTLTGDGNANIIHGMAGDDVIAGGGGNDVIYGEAGNNTLAGEAGNDIIYGGYNDDVISGGDGNNQLYGGGGNDKITGGNVGDIIEGDSGADLLTGGGGSDIFVYKYYYDSYASSPDVITDFQTGIDKLDVRALHLTATDKFSISSSGGNTYVSVDYTGDGTTDSLIKLIGSNVIKTSDVLWANAAFPAAIAHHDLAATSHAAAVDHGLYG